MERPSIPPLRELAIRPVGLSEGEIADLEDELAEELEEIWGRWKDVADEVEDFEIPLERTDVSMDEMVLFWGPVE